MTRVLHVTPHLGGGVGKALACLAEAHAAHGPDVAHEIACLDAPEKLDFVERVRALGVPVAIAPSRASWRRSSSVPTSSSWSSGTTRRRWPRCAPARCPRCGSSSGAT
ncbi:MAG: hypothetical protein U1E86_24725 [Burkholderiaceae bacterium]